MCCERARLWQTPVCAQPWWKCSLARDVPRDCLRFKPRMHTRRWSLGACAALSPRRRILVSGPTQPLAEGKETASRLMQQDSGCRIVKVPRSVACSPIEFLRHAYAWVWRGACLVASLLAFVASVAPGVYGR